MCSSDLNADKGFRALEGEGGWSAVLATPATPGDFALEALEKRDVLLHPGHFYDIAPEGFAVVSLLAEPGTFEEAIARLGSLA